MELLAGFRILEGQWGWIGQVFVVVLAVVAVNFVQRRVLARLAGRLKGTANLWDDTMVEAARRPATLAIWIVGLAFAARIVREATGAVIFEVAEPAREVGVIGALAWFLIRLVNGVERAVLETREVDRTTVDAVAKLLRVSVIITAALVILQTLGFSISGVLAFGGIGGIAVGFAARDVLANFFGGLMVYLDRPFAVGDWIYSPDRDIEGTVERIGWRLTQIRTFDKRPIYVPNATFASIAVVNPSRMTHRRIYETIGVRYDDVEKVPAILEDIRRMLREHPEIAQDQTLMVHFDRFGPSSLDFFVYCFTRTTQWVRYHEVKEDVLLRIHEIIARHGAEVAFPTTTVHVPEPVEFAGLDLGGAEARGWAHIGVIEALGERGIVPEVVAGTSIGALVGGAYAAERLEALRDWVLGLRWQDVVSYLDPAFNGGLIAGRRLFDFFRAHFEDRRIEDLPRPYAATATDLDTGREVWLRDGSLLEAVRASIALPGLFTPVLRDGRVLVDGGLVDPVPVSLCRALGAERVIAVDLNADVIRRLPRRHGADDEEAQGDDEGGLRALLRSGAEGLRRRLLRDGGGPSMMEVVLRSVHIMQYRITRSRMAGDPPDVLLIPRVGDVALMEFHRAAHAIAEGRDAVMAAAAELEALAEP